MTELSYQAIRTANQAREADELKTETRKKNILILVLNYLNEEGYLDSAQALGRETNIDVTKFEVCDNIDLETIVMEYESYYYVKFAKYPKICKKLTQSGDRRTKMNRTNSQKNNTPSLPRIPQNGRPQSPPQSSNRPKSGGVNRQRSVQSSTRRPNEGGAKSNPSIMNGVANGDASGLALQGLTVQGSNNANVTEHKAVESPSERMPRNKTPCDITNLATWPTFDEERDWEKEDDQPEFEFDMGGESLNHSDIGEEIYDDSETEMEQDLQRNTDQEKDGDLDPLYPGAPISVGAVMLLLSLFVTKHSLVGDGIQQLLQIISLLLPDGHKLCTSIKSFKTFFRNLKNPLIKHYYCGYCMGCINDSSVKFCPYEKCRKSLKEKMDYFLEMPVKSQLQKLLAQKDFYLHLQHRFNFPKDRYLDIYNGQLYKSYFDNEGPLSNPDNISFTFNTDGASVFKSSNVSVWPLFLVINELPYHLRMKKENMILAGLWFGNKKPAMGTYLHPFLETFKELENGIEINSPNKTSPILLKGYLLCGTADLPARSLICNSIQFNGSFSCWKCLQKGETAKVGKGHTHIFPFKADHPKQPSRTKESVINDSQKSLDLHEAGAKNFITNGIKGPSWLTFFPKFEIVHGIAIDYMHGVLLGIQKLLLTLWFSPSHKGKVFNFHGQVSIADERILHIRPISAISRLPRSISRDLKYWKASEFRSFLLYYGAPILNGLIDEQRFYHFVLLVNAVYILLKSGSSDSDINRAETLLFEFVKLFPELYDKCFMTLNVHQLLHLADSVRYLGPLYTHSCFSFEDKNGVLLKMIRGTQNIDNQILTGVSFLQKLPELKQTTIEKGSDLEDLYNSIENPNILKRGLKLNKDIYILGAIKTKTLSDKDHRAVCQHLGFFPVSSQFKCFKRLEYHNHLIYGTTYSRMVKRDNSTVCYKTPHGTEKFGKISYFILLDVDGTGDSVLAILEALDCRNYGNDSNILAVENTGNTLAISLESIVESCVHVYVKEKRTVSFICRIPNTLESD